LLDLYPDNGLRLGFKVLAMVQGTLLGPCNLYVDCRRGGLPEHRPEFRDPALYQQYELAVVSGEAFPEMFLGELQELCFLDCHGKKTAVLPLRAGQAAEKSL
jgi:hypothetical protein